MRTPELAAWRSSLRGAALVAAITVPLTFSSAVATAADDGAGFATDGCHPVLLLDVVDGDTVQGYIDTSDPSVAVRVKIRIDGIDTPETGGRARCVEERRRAADAKAFLLQLLAPGLERPTRRFARACAVRDDKYASRRLSRLEIAGADRHWLDVGELMIRRGFAFPYHGGRRGDSWCTCLKSGQCPAGYQGSS